MESVITSAKNPRIKAAAELRDRKERDARKLFLIDGEREILRALDAGIELIELYECGTSLSLAVNTGMMRFQVAPAAFEKLAYGERRHGAVAVARQFSVSLERFAEKAPQRVCVYVGVEKPGNVGALLRTADAAGIDGVILADARTDIFNPNVVRASAGAIFSMPLAAASAADVIQWLDEKRFRIYAARVDGAIDYRHVDWAGPCAVVLGSEAEGLDAAWRGAGVTAISLPMRGEVDSLNVSVTAGILLYEMMREER